MRQARYNIATVDIAKLAEGLVANNVTARMIALSVGVKEQSVITWLNKHHRPRKIATIVAVVELAIQKLNDEFLGACGVIEEPVVEAKLTMTQFNSKIDLDAMVDSINAQCFGGLKMKLMDRINSLAVTLGLPKYEYDVRKSDGKGFRLGEK